MVSKLIADTTIGNITCIGSFCPENTDSLAGGSTPIENLFTMLFGFLTIVGGLAFLIYFVIGAITWITSGGDTGNVDKAKKMMTNAAIGMIIIAATYAIITIVGTVLGIDILNFSTVISQLIPGNG